MGIIRIVCVGVLVSVISTSICDDKARGNTKKLVQTCGRNLKDLVKSTSKKICSRGQSQQ